MYAKTDEELATAISTADALKGQKKFVKRLLENLKRAKEWVALHRQTVLPQSDGTKSFIETSLRIVKDTFFHRTKLFNIVGLVEFCAVIFERLCESRLLDFVRNQRTQRAVLYHVLSNSEKGKDQIIATRLSDSVFEIPAGDGQSVTYVVNVDVGMCSCLAGSRGTFCKQQAWLHKHFNTSVPDLPAIEITNNERFELTRLAIGDDCLGVELFQVRLVFVNYDYFWIDRLLFEGHSPEFFKGVWHSLSLSM